MISPIERREPHSEQITSAHEFLGKDGNPYEVIYYNFPGLSGDENRHNLEDPRLANIQRGLEEMIRGIFPNYSDETVNSTLSKFDSFNRFAFTFNPEGKAVAFNLYKISDVETSAGNAKVVYVEHAGTLPEFRNTGITQEMRNELFRQENPDII